MFQQGKIILIMMILTDLCDFVVHRRHWAHQERAQLIVGLGHDVTRFRNIIRQLDGCRIGLIERR